MAEAEQTGAKIFFVDEAHFYADADLRGKWVLKGSPPWSTRPAPAGARRPATTRRSAWRPARSRRWSWTATAAPRPPWPSCASCAPRHPEPLIVIWDNGPAHGGDALRAYLATPDLRLRLVRLPAYSPDFNADEAIWGWIREEVTANTCFGTKAKVREHVDAFFHGLKSRIDEVKTRCRTVLQAHALAPAAM